MTEPILEEQLLGLQPKTKVTVGIAMAVTGGIACEWLWDRGWIVGFAVFALVMGALLAWSGRQELARERAIESEVARARSEWEDLREGVAAATRDGRSVVRYLQERGYREYAVRRWIAQELENEAGPG